MHKLDEVPPQGWRMRNQFPSPAKDRTVYKTVHWPLPFPKVRVSDLNTRCVTQSAQVGCNDYRICPFVRQGAEITKKIKKKPRKLKNRPRKPKLSVLKNHKRVLYDQTSTKKNHTRAKNQKNQEHGFFRDDQENQEKPRKTMVFLVATKLCGGEGCVPFGFLPSLALGEYCRKTCVFISGGGI